MSNPRIPQERISPIPTVNIKYGIVPSAPYAKDSTKGIINVFARIGGITARKRFPLSNLVPIAPKRVARLPKITSQTTAPARMFDKRHPTKRPGIAAGVKIGKIQSASEKRSWIAPESSPNNLASRVSIT